MLPSGVAMTMRAMLGLPSSRAMEEASSVTSSTSAISEIRTADGAGAGGAPGMAADASAAPAEGCTHRSSIASRLVCWSPVVTLRLRPSSSMEPPAMSRPLDSSVLDRSWTLTPASTSSSSSGVISTRSSGRPVRFAERTPGTDSSSGMSTFSMVDAIACSSPFSEAAASSITGIMSMLMAMTEVSTSSGSMPAIWSTATWTSRTRASWSRP